MIPTQFAQVAAQADTAETSNNVFDALGIDWQMLLFQVIGFVILVWLMGKFVYPVLMKQVDERQDKIEEGLKAAREAEKNAASAEEKIDKQLREARKEAKDIVATAKDEAAIMLSKAEEKAKANAENTLKTARDEIDKEVIAAKKALHNETLELVAAATEKVIGKTYSAKADKAVITSALKEADK
ncbi:MAG TPA: F0F1 ATP synthase subunit B [Patescibacteria group bacterium]|jgi:F-type H+-transporting ATPase subunit b|nr:F0F1 ATP synthase subunit B [Patescibacteria group bacterium]